MPGDPLAGYLLAGAAGATAGGAAKAPLIIPAVCTSVLLYAMGLVQNDLADAKRDARDRPERPIPSGAIARPRAAVVMCVLGGLAVLTAAATNVMATFILAVALLALITLYNCVTSRAPVARPINMGLCRGASLLLGASVAGGWAALRDPIVLAATATLVLYIAAITAIASKETTTSRIGPLRWAPALALAAGFGAILLALRPPQTVDAAASCAVAILAVAWAVVCGARLAGVCEPARVGRTIGMLVRGLLPIQAAMAAAAGGAGLWVAGGLLAAWPVSGLLARRFASS